MFYNSRLEQFNLAFKMKHINELIDDCLRLLFRQFPLHDAIPLRNVCHRWRDIIEQMLSEKTSLKVFYKFTELGHYCELLGQAVFHSEPDFQLDRFDEHGGSFGEDFICIPHVWSSHNFVPFKCDLLPRIFPNVRKLILWCGHEYSDVNVIHLLEQWQDLEQLALFDISAKLVGKSKSSPQQLWQVINSMKSLKQLTLFYCQMEFGFCERKPNPRPFVNLSKVMPQFEHFSVGQFSLDLLSFLRPLNNAKNLKSLTLWNNQSRDVHLKLDKALTINSGLKQSIKRFKIYPVYPKLLTVIVTNLQELTYLNIATTTGVKFTNFIQAISNLKNLIELRFNFSRQKLIEPGQTVYSTLCSMAVPLKSIKILHSSILFTSDEYRSIFPMVFANVEVLSLSFAMYLPEARAEESVQAYLDKFERITKESSPPLFEHLRQFRCYHANRKNHTGRHLKEYDVWEDFWQEKLGTGKYAIQEED